MKTLSDDLREKLCRAWLEHGGLTASEHNMQWLTNTKTPERIVLAVKEATGIDITEHAA